MLMTGGGGMRTLTEAKLDPDFLRQMYFDAGNYFYRKNVFEIAAEMFKMSLYWSKPVLNWMQIFQGINPYDFYSYMYFLGYQDIWKEFAKLPKSQIVFDKGMTAPSYYSAYNLFCSETRLGHENLENLEFALFLGFPVKEYSNILKDDDLSSIRKFNNVQLLDLLRKYQYLNQSKEN